MTVDPPGASMIQPDLTHEHTLRPEFYDVDPMDIVWHGNYVKYLEAARAALLEKFGYGYHAMRDSGYVWPIVDMRLKYVGSAVFGDPIVVRCEIVEWENRLRINYVIRDVATGRKLTEAYTIQVAVDIATREMCFVSPPVLWERLGVSGLEQDR
jgi:acyl-CoA thioester hydrolase